MGYWDKARLILAREEGEEVAELDRQKRERAKEKEGQQITRATARAFLKVFGRGCPVKIYGPGYVDVIGPLGAVFRVRDKGKIYGSRRHNWWIEEPYYHTYVEGPATLLQAVEKIASLRRDTEESWKDI